MGFRLSTLKQCTQILRIRFCASIFKSAAFVPFLPFEFEVQKKMGCLLPE